MGKLLKATALPLLVLSLFFLSLFILSQPIWAEGENVEVIYVGDPMCSWCYGFSPEYSKFSAAYGHKADFRVLMGGLHPYTTAPMTEAKKEFLREHWSQIGAYTGQPFNFDVLKVDGFVYDTEPASRAVIVMQDLSPSDTFAFFKSIQHAFYVENKDTTVMDTFVVLASRFDIDVKEFQARFASDAYKEKTRRQFAEARALGARGFPTVLVKKGTVVKVLANGYTSADMLGERLESEL